VGIRRARGEDIPAIMKLLGQVLEVHHSGRPDLFRSGGAKYTQGELERIFADPLRPVFIYDGGRGAEGYAFCVMKKTSADSVLTDGTELYIDDLCVDESLRGRHIGTALWQHVLEYARSSGCRFVTLNVWECNTGARKFYDSLGMRPRKTMMEFPILNDK
jgi:ribosomal protein S18 acetylase RimI-like enzyme